MARTWSKHEHDDVRWLTLLRSDMIKSQKPSLLFLAEASHACQSSMFTCGHDNSALVWWERSVGMIGIRPEIISVGTGTGVSHNRSWIFLRKTYL
jgi:hypothetical protein